MLTDTIAIFSHNLARGANKTTGQKAMSCEPSAKQLPISAGGALCLDVLEIALDQAKGGRWYVSTLQLQLASFQLCFACRNQRTLSVTVDQCMPLSLWGGNDFSGSLRKATEKRRLPVLRAAGVRWRLPADLFVPVLSQSNLLKGLTRIKLFGVSNRSWSSNMIVALRCRDTFHGPQSRTETMPSPRQYFEVMLRLFDLVSINQKAFRDVIRYTTRPASLRRLELGWDVTDNRGRLTLSSLLGRFPTGIMVEQLIGRMVLPTSLLELTIGGDFSPRITNIIWPESLMKLTFVGLFDQPITGVVWPASLLELTYDGVSNAPIAGVHLPESLLKLTFGRLFNEPITGVTWPSSLLELTLGDKMGEFNQPITHVLWPESLLELTFGERFNQPIADCLWPATLVKLKFGTYFDQPVIGVNWPASLLEVEFGDRFNQPLQGTVWPASLSKLTFGHSFDQQISDAVWPTSLLEVTFGCGFTQQIDDAVWPTSLMKLKIEEK